MKSEHSFSHSYTGDLREVDDSAESLGNAAKARKLREESKPTTNVQSQGDDRRAFNSQRNARK